MKSFTDIKRMQRRCEDAKAREAHQIRKLHGEEQKLTEDIDALDRQFQAMALLLDGRGIENRTLDLAALSSELRTHSAIRRRRRELTCQIAELENRAAQVRIDRSRCEDQLRYWMKRADRYQRWGAVLSRVLALQQAREQTEALEERIAWTKSR
ncbi:hypothetical protein PTE30175_01232 [Pandoraea terrae]|uniref:Uncharacterized protein n=2 Tax=Pandoraea terrae TaxID=1537710 RepID=A0A5E4TC75_9BURK|nr:hypothetical protein PTE30175_01232 [Pandoraea terrae]